MMSGAGRQHQNVPNMLRCRFGWADLLNFLIQQEVRTEKVYSFWAHSNRYHSAVLGDRQGRIDPSETVVLMEKFNRQHLELSLQVR